MLPTIVDSFKYQVMASTATKRGFQREKKIDMNSRDEIHNNFSEKGFSGGKINTLYPKEKISKIQNFKVQYQTHFN